MAVFAMSASVVGVRAVPGRPNTKALKEIVTGGRRISGFTFDDAAAKVAYVATSHAKPTELFIANADGRRAPAHEFNDALNAQVAWSDAERFTYNSLGNREIEAAHEPYGYEAGRSTPVLYIHGDRTARMARTGSTSSRTSPGLGCGLVHHPRGSSGYGGTSRSPHARAGSTKT